MDSTRKREREHDVVRGPASQRPPEGSVQRVDSNVLASAFQPGEGTLCCHAACLRMETEVIPVGNDPCTRSAHDEVYHVYGAALKHPGLYT